MKTALIAAIGPNNELGIKGDLPWKIKEDLQYFKKVTMGATVIMGLGTWKSMGEKALPGRLNIVLSTKLAKKRGIKFGEYDNQTVLFAKDIEQALFVAEYQKKPVFFIGGANVYAQVLDKVDTLYLSIVEKMTGSIEADTFFPDFDIEQYERVAQTTYFTAEYTVTNLVLAKKSDGKRTDREPSSLGNKTTSGAIDRGKSSKLHWQGAGIIPNGRPRNLGY